MIIALLYLSVFLRPIFFIDFAKGSGLQAFAVFDWFAVALLVMLAGAMFANVALRRQLRLSGTDLAVIGFSVWCVTGFLLYPEKGNNGRELIKLLFPLFTYFVARNVLHTREEYSRMLWWMILGFVVPVIWSAVLIASGGGVERVLYWSQEVRYEGIYSAAHNLAHNMAFLVMLLLTYVALRQADDFTETGRAQRRWQRVTMIGLGAAAVYCLAMSKVRTPMLGLMVFISYYLYMYQRKFLFVAIVPMCVVALAIFGPTLYDTLFFDFAKVSQGEWRAEEMGSGRPIIWRQNLEFFSSLPLDRQLSGVGVGNTLTGTLSIGDSHNDYLDLLVESGIVGILLYFWLQFSIYRAISRIPGRERHAFIGMFVAVALMNLMSNSYITRSGLAQMYFFVMAYAEMRRALSVRNTSGTRDIAQTKPIARPNSR